jgi:hypothetical protein
MTTDELMRDLERARALVQRKRDRLASAGDAGAVDRADEVLRLIDAVLSQPFSVDSERCPPNDYDRGWRDGHRQALKERGNE